MCTTKECSTVGGCPFSFTEESETIQNYGCLPSPIEILSMRIDSNKTWACHSNPSKPCLGAINKLNELEYESKVIDPNLVTEDDDWSAYIKDSKDSINQRRLNILMKKDFEQNYLKSL